MIEDLLRRRKNNSRLFFLVAFLTLISSCSNSSIDQKSYNVIQKRLKLLRSETVINQYGYLNNLYISSHREKIIKLDKNTKKYIENIISKLYRFNETFLPNVEKIEIIVLDEKIPFFFSLPSGQIYLSNLLFKKYFKSESLFNAIIAIELYKMANKIYLTIPIIPLGHVDINQLVAISRLPTEQKFEIYKWAYHVLNRSGYDPSAILSTIQLISKHHLEFYFQNGDVGNPSREEFLFKSYIVKEQLNLKLPSENENSSQDFYKFIRSIM